MRLIPARPSGRAAAFVQRAGGGPEARATFFLQVQEEVAPQEEAAGAEEAVRPGDLLAVCSATDAEAGDLVVWRRGRRRALARVEGGAGEELRLLAVRGFPPPASGAALEGVVVGCLRRAAGAS